MQHRTSAIYILNFTKWKYKHLLFEFCYNYAHQNSRIKALISKFILRLPVWLPVTTFAYISLPPEHLPKLALAPALVTRVSRSYRRNHHDALSIWVAFAFAMCGFPSLRGCWPQSPPSLTSTPAATMPRNVLFRKLDSDTNVLNDRVENSDNNQC